MRKMLRKNTDKNFASLSMLKIADFAARAVAALMRTVRGLEVGS